MKDIDISAFDEPLNETEIDISAFDEPINSGPSMLESALRGPTQGFTRSWGEEISPKIERGLANLIGDEQTKSYYDSLSDKDLSQTYERQNLAAEKANPKLFNTTKFLSSLPLSFATGGGGLATQIGVSGLDAALQTMGESKSEGTDLLKEGLYGGALGAGLTGATPFAGKALSKGLDWAGDAVSKTTSPLRNYVGNKIDDLAQHFTLGSLGGTKGQFKDLLENEDPAALYKMLIDRKIVQPGDNVDSIITKLSAELKKEGQAIGSTLKTADDFLETMPGLNPEAAAALRQSTDVTPGSFKKRIENELLGPATSEMRGNQGNANAIRRFIDEEITGLPLDQRQSLEALGEFKTNLGDQINFARRNTNPTERSFSDLYGKVAGIQRERVGSVGEYIPGLDKTFDSANTNYSTLRTGLDMAKDKRAAEAANRYLSLGDAAYGTAGAVAASFNDNDPIDSLAGFGGAALANRMFRTRGAAVAGPLLNRLASAVKPSDSLSKALMTNPTMFGKYAKPLLSAAQRGAQNLAISNYVLSETDPEYRSMIERLNNESQ